MTTSLVFDVETTGLPAYTNGRLYPYRRSSKYPRLVSVAWVVLRRDAGRLESSEHWVIRPKGFTIENEHVHGISAAAAARDGVPLRRVVARLLACLDRLGGDLDELVAHNMSFDINVLLAELHRRGHEEAVRRLRGLRLVCTMRTGAALLDLPRWPRLPALCDRLDVAFEGAQHDALADARACARCYLRLGGHAPHQPWGDTPQNV